MTMMLTGCAGAVCNSAKYGVGNTLERGTEKVANAGKTTAALAITAGGVAGATALANTKTGGNAVRKGARKVGAFIEKHANSKTGQNILTKLSNFATKGVEKFSKLSGPAKLVAGLGTAAASIAAVVIGHKHSYNNGKIDQKYEDKAAIQKMIA